MVMPSIARYMTRQPWTVHKDATLARAHQIMREHRIRHLPVLDAGKLVGIVTERDLHLIETLPGGNPEDVMVEEAMTEEVYTVQADEPVDAVVEMMSNRKLGSAIVLDRNGRVGGIFTAVDGLRVLADVLRRATAWEDTASSR